MRGTQRFFFGFTVFLGLRANSFNEFFFNCQKKNSLPLFAELFSKKRLSRRTIGVFRWVECINLTQLVLSIWSFVNLAVSNDWVFRWVRCNNKLNLCCPYGVRGSQQTALLRLLFGLSVTINLNLCYPYGVRGLPRQNECRLEQHTRGCSDL